MFYPYSLRQLEQTDTLTWSVFCGTHEHPQLTELNNIAQHDEIRNRIENGVATKTYKKHISIKRQTQ